MRYKATRKRLGDKPASLALDVNLRMFFRKVVSENTEILIAGADLALRQKSLNKICLLLFLLLYLSL